VAGKMGESSSSSGCILFKALQEKLFLDIGVLATALLRFDVVVSVDRTSFIFRSFLEDFIIHRTTSSSVSRKLEGVKNGGFSLLFFSFKKEQVCLSVFFCFLTVCFGQHVNSKEGKQ
jgi:hypothetical protein